MIPKIYLDIYEFLMSMGISVEWLRFATTATLWAAAILLCLLVYQVWKTIVIPIVHIWTRKTKTDWDNYLLTDKVLRAIGRFLSSLVLARYLPSASLYYPQHIGALVIACRVIILIFFFWLIFLFINTVYNACRKQNKEIHGLSVYRNILQAAIGVVAALIIASVLLNKNITLILSGLGAMAAVLMLVFQDSILGFVAGLKLTINKMLSRGDWIIVPNHGANGIVEDVRLSTIKVRNWDNSVVTVPPYALISNGFQNLEEMKRTGGRRIMRSLLIDFNTIRRLTLEEQEKFADEEWSEGLKLNKRRYVNVTLFRKYLEHYISNYPTCVPEMLNMVRELEPTAEGLPVEIYLFTDRTEWREFEQVQSDLMDDVIAAVGDFDLRIYQKPSFYKFQESENIFWGSENSIKEGENRIQKQVIG